MNEEKKIPPMPIPPSADTVEEALVDLAAAVVAAFTIGMIENGDAPIDGQTTTLIVAIKQWEGTGFFVKEVEECSHSIVEAFIEAEKESRERRNGENPPANRGA